MPFANDLMPRQPIGPLPENTLAPRPTWAQAYETTAPLVQQHFADQWADWQRPEFWVDKAGQYANALMMGTTAPGFRAFHGSPHSFERFDSSKIGTGEGAQVYGHGLYLAGAEQTAKTYRDALSSPLTAPSGEMFRPAAYSADDIAKQLLQESKGDWTSAIARANADLAASRKIGDGEWLKKFGGIPDRLKEMQEQGYTYNTKPGHMYEVQVNADPAHFLDWDKPMAQQPERVQTALGYRDPAGVAEEITRRRAAGDNATADFLESQHYSMTSRANLKPHEIFNLNDPALVGKLHEAGIPGIRYLDQGSRASGEGTSNHVIFDANTMEILRKYGIAGLIAGGGAAAGAQQ